jgi:hypothetical protein
VENECELFRVWAEAYALGWDDGRDRLCPDMRENPYRRVHAGTAIGCRLAALLLRREPTPNEGLAVVDTTGFVEHGGWTVRRCVTCDAVVFGGPTRCAPCVARIDADQTIAALRREIARLTDERDAILDRFDDLRGVP